MRRFDPIDYLNMQCAVLGLFFGIGLACTGMYCQKKQAILNASSCVMVTAAHLDDSEFPGWSRVYDDTHKDVAVYVNFDNKVSNLAVGDNVCDESKTLKGEVIEVTDDGFVFKAEDSSVIKHGDSGKSIYHKSHYVGFVSGVRNIDEIICKAY